MVIAAVVAVKPFGPVQAKLAPATDELAVSIKELP